MSGVLFDSYDVFNAAFERNLVRALQSFRWQYPTIQFSIDGTSGLDSFNNLCDAIRQKQDLGLYILVDEYDNSVMKLATQPATAQLMRERASSVAPTPSHYSCFWSAVKAAQQECPVIRLAVTGITPMALTEFAGSGANHLLPLEFRARFRGLFGLSRDEVLSGLGRITPPLPEALRGKVLRWMEEHMNGYRLNKRQEDGVFNPARVMYALSNIQDAWAREQKDSLDYLLDFQDDPQTKPAESSLAELVVSRGPARAVLSQLLGSNRGVPCPGGVKRGFTFSAMGESREDLLSYLYFTGAVTHGYAPDAPEPHLVIPNKEARSDYLEAAHRLLELTKSDLRRYQDAVRSLVDKQDVGPLAQAFMAIDKNRTGHSEAEFHEALFAGLALARRPHDRVQDEPVVGTVIGVAREAFDILYEAHGGGDGQRRLFYLELRNLCLGGGKVSPELELPQHIQTLTDWHARADKFVEWSSLNKDKIDETKLVPLYPEDPAWKRQRWAPTVRKYLAKAVSDVQLKYVPLLSAPSLAGREVHVWVLVRVGVGIVRFAKCA